MNIENLNTAMNKISTTLRRYGKTVPYEVESEMKIINSLIEGFIHTEAPSKPSDPMPEQHVKLKYKTIFEGSVTVLADSLTEAMRWVKGNIGMSLETTGHYEHKCADSDIDWNPTSVEWTEDSETEK